MSETTKLRKVGNSAGVSLPKQVIEALQLHLGEELQLTIRGDCLIIRKVQTLKDLLASVPENETSEEWKTGHATGQEVIDDE
ncbi:MAG: AbrB/MazE/SpoVT family DNA-binding domain-containing protein [Deltaproteobacteria bacterium]|nr:AbrB/MazE/SpoVT family DNA-binding domain-containing protein [Deltaproteobacteria bacterium]